MAEFEDLMAAMNEPGYAEVQKEIILDPETPQEDEAWKTAEIPEEPENSPRAGEAQPENVPEEEYEEEYEEEDETEYHRPRKKKKRRKKHYFLRFLIFVALVVGTFKFLSSDYFRVTQIKVEGNHYYTKAQIVEMAGIQTGYNMFFETKTAPARATLLDDPYIKLVSIKKEPRDTIRIVVEEREEYAAVPYGDNFILIDETGMVLRISDKEPILPLLEGLTLVEMRPGSALAVEQAYLLTDTLQLISSMDENDIYFKKIYFSSVVVRAYIYDELYCEGTPENINHSMDDIYKLLTQLYKENITHGVIKVGTDDYLAYSPQYE